MAIGVMGCLTSLPDTFPLEFAENSGNMIHANAPFEMFNNCVYIKDQNIKLYGNDNFVDFVNSKCSHLIITLANTLKLEEANGDKYKRLHLFLQKIEKPIVTFGLGVQSPNETYNAQSLPIEAIELMKYLSNRCVAIGVRGKFTKKVLEEVCGVKNVFITGCPSLFSRPSNFVKLRQNLNADVGRPAYCGTRFFEDNEKIMLFNSIKNSCFLIEPVNKFNYEFFLNCQRGVFDKNNVPYYLKGFMSRAIDGLSYEQIVYYFNAYFKLFRNVNDWYTFNKEVVSFTYGTRFHVNMASILSGKPAVWFTHDSRTRELVEFMHLPSIPLSEGCHLHPDDILKSVTYDDFFDNISALFENFNEYLSIVGLPKIKFES